MLGLKLNHVSKRGHKSMYVISHGIAPYVQSLLVKQIMDADKYFALWRNFKYGIAEDTDGHTYKNIGQR